MAGLKMNVGNKDRKARGVVGIILIGVGIAMMGTWGLVVGIIGLIPLVTALIGWCPLYSLFKIDTCKLLRH